MYTRHICVSVNETVAELSPENAELTKALGELGEGSYDTAALLLQRGLAAVVADDVSVAGKSRSKALFVTAGSCEPISGTKEEVADGILERAARLL